MGLGVRVDRYLGTYVLLSLSSVRSGMFPSRRSRMAVQAEHDEEVRHSSHTYPVFMGTLKPGWGRQLRGSRSPQNEQVGLLESRLVVESRGVVPGRCARRNLPNSCFAR